MVNLFSSRQYLLAFGCEDIGYTLPVHVQLKNLYHFGEPISLAMVWHLDVGLSFPKSVGGIIGGSAHPLRRYVSWVKHDVNQFGLYL